MPILISDSTVDHISDTDFEDTNELMNDKTDQRNERLLLQTDLYNANNYFGTLHNDNKGINYSFNVLIVQLFH